MKLPVISGKEMIRLLSRQGFQTVRQRGDHVSLYRKLDNVPLLVVIPMKKEIKKGTLLSILRQAKLSREEFMRLAKDI